MSTRHPEALLISALLQSHDVLAAEHLGLHPGHFHEYTTQYEWLCEYKLKYRTEPSKVSFLTAFPDFPLLEHDDVVHAADLVRQNHLRVEVTKALRTATTTLKEGEPEAALAHLHSQAMALQQGYDTAANLTNSLFDYHDALDYALSKTGTEARKGVPFGHLWLNERTGGMEAGDLWVKAARLGQGKTWDLVNDGSAALLSGRKVMHFALEMSRRQMLYRYHVVLAHKLGLKSGVDHHALTTGQGLDGLAYKDMLQQIEKQVHGELLICDKSRGGVTPLSIAAQINRHNPDLVIVDYLTLLGSSSGGRATDDWRNAANISGELQEVAARFGVPILAAAQINRDGDRAGWKPPKAKHLAQSDNIGQDCAGLVTMKRYGKGAMVYSLEKYRHGEDGGIFFSTFDVNHGDMRECSKTDADYIREISGELEEEDQFV